MDICSAMQEVKHVIKALDRVRDEIDTNRSSWYKEAAAMGEAVDAEPPKLPRTNNRQRHRANVPASNPEEYYQRAVTIPFLDHLLSEMKARFSPAQETAIAALAIIPSVMASDPDWKEKALALADRISKDLPSPELVSAEFDCWKQKWNSVNDRPESGAAALRLTSKSFFPNIHTMFCLVATLPVTLCESER